MEHLTLKAATTATDEGVFEAVISSATIDREKDVVNPAGMVRALQKWASSGKRIPLAWMHSTAADQQIGYIDPSSARVQGHEVVARGWIDQSTEVGGHAWRLVKTGTLGFSFGYLTLKGSPRQGGGRNLEELDVFEVTATPVPMNNDTRVLGWKSEKGDKDDMPPEAPDAEASDAEALRQRAKQVEREAEEARLPEVPEVKQTPPSSGGGGPARMIQSMIAQAREFIATDPAADDREAMQEVLALLLDLADEEAQEGELPQSAADGKAVRSIDILLKAVWSTAYINDLPDSAFLYIEPGGEKDSEGKTTPRSLRHFPVRDANGNVDQVHVRNALSRIPQSNLSQDVKDRATAKAQRLLDSSKSVDETGKGTSKSRSVDPLREKADAVMLEFASGGESLRRPPRTKAKPPPELLPLPELKRRMREETLTALSGGTINDE